MAHSLWFLGAVIFVFCAMSFSQVDPSLAKIRPADIPVMNSDDPLAAPSYQSGQWFSDGAAGIFNALPGPSTSLQIESSSKVYCRLSLVVHWI